VLIINSKEKQHANALTDIDRATAAEALLSNPLYVEAIKVMESAMYVEFESTKMADSENRHELWQRMQLMKQFRGRFESIVKQGNHARTTLKMLLDKSKSLTGLR
jgi:hypothetical protein|tara:strand:+ start:315 stop:629 length:315 start_codon:yes stop_codon:yes gene_type:complete